MVTQYNSYTTHYKEAECLRQMVEPFLYNFGVDVVFHGAAQACSVFCLIGRSVKHMRTLCGRFPADIVCHCWQYTLHHDSAHFLYMAA